MSPGIKRCSMAGWAASSGQLQRAVLRTHGTTDCRHTALTALLASGLELALSRLTATYSQAPCWLAVLLSSGSSGCRRLRACFTMRI